MTIRQGLFDAYQRALVRRAVEPTIQVSETWRQQSILDIGSITTALDDGHCRSILCRETVRQHQSRCTTSDDDIVKGIAIESRGICSDSASVQRDSRGQWKGESGECESCSHRMRRY